MVDPLAHRSKASSIPPPVGHNPMTQTTVEGEGLNKRYPLDAGRKLSIWDELRSSKPAHFLGSNIPLHNGLLTRPTRSDDEDDANSTLTKAIEQAERNQQAERNIRPDANQNVSRNRPLSNGPSPRVHPPRAPKRTPKSKKPPTSVQGPSLPRVEKSSAQQDTRTETNIISSEPNEDIQAAASAQLQASVDQQPITDARIPSSPIRESVPQANGSLHPDEGLNRVQEGPPEVIATEVSPKHSELPVEAPLEKSASPGILHDEEAIGPFMTVETELQSKPSQPFPLEAKEIQAHLNQCISQMREAQTDLLRPSLQMARLQAEKYWKPFEHTKDPWADVNPVFPPNMHSIPREEPTSEALKLESNVYGTGYTPREKMNVTIPTIGFKSNAPTLPKYKSIVRLGPNMLAENDRTLKYLPYFPDEEGVDGDDSKTELRLELEQRFHSRVDRLSDWQGCIGKSDLYREATKKFLRDVGSSFNDILYYLHFDDKNAEEWRPPQLDSDEAVAALTESCHIRCPVCDQFYGGRKWERIFPRLRVPSDRELGLAAMVYFAFYDAAAFSIWHIVVTDPEITGLLQSQQQEQIAEVEAAGLRCSLCGTHDCPTHGAYLEHESHDSDSSSEIDESSDTDNELGHNHRQRINKPTPQHRDPAQQHLCGPYCVDSGTRLCDLMGSHADGNVSGHYNKSQEASGKPGLEDDEICDTECFWQVELRVANGEPLTIEQNNASLRRQRFWNWNATDIELYRKLLPVYVKYRRGPCLMAMSIPQTCIQIFTEMLFDMYAMAHTAADDPGITVQPKAHNERNGSWWLDHSITCAHDERVPFQPCSHEGLCDGNPNCSCWSGKVACEYLCGCPRDCIRRYQGCKCAAKGRPCSTEDRCDCMLLNRECDPWLCTACGVVDVLDPVNRYDDAILKDRCRNANIQRNRPKRTLKGISEVHGWGLFAGEEIRKDDFIGEYKGEVITREEADRRGAVYHYRGLEYLFSLNRDQEVDSSRAGNKMRFINNQNDSKNQNCYSRKMLCNGIQRIGLYAKGPKTIEPGTELFFCYGYPDSVTKYFWEKGEKPVKGVAMPVAKARKAYASGKVRAIKEKKGLSIPTEKKKKGGRPRKIRPPDLEAPIADPPNASMQEPAEAFEVNGSPNPRLSGRRKRKRVLVDGADDENDIFQVPRGSSLPEMDSRTFDLRGRLRLSPAYIDSGEVPESGDEDYNEQSSDGSDGIDELGDDAAEEEDSDNDDDEESDGGRPQWGKGTRGLRAGDTRYGGAVQRRGWITRRRNLEKRLAEGVSVVDKRRGGKRG